ncbi:MAG: cytochrome c oxidase subunit II, partial [Candidatus Dormibacteria bacterium]
VPKCGGPSSAPPGGRTGDARPSTHTQGVAVILATGQQPIAFYNSSPLHPDGPVAQRIQDVYTPVFWAAVALFVFVGGLIIYSALRFRRKSDDEEPAQVHGNNRLEIAWTIVPFGILFSLFIVTAVNMNFITHAPDGALKVCVLGQRFSWSYYYNTDCGSAVQVKGGENNDTKLSYRNILGKHAASTLMVPAGRPVALEVVSADVNHSFYLPTLGGQINAIPNQLNHMWFQADKVGSYYGQCTELCGDNHYAMEIVVQAVPGDQFKAFVDRMEGNSASTGSSAGGQ